MSCFYFQTEQAAHIHIGYLNQIKTPSCNRNFIKQHRNVLGSMFTLRYASTDTPPPVVPVESPIPNQLSSDVIPEPPVLPTNVSDIAVEVSLNKIFYNYREFRFEFFGCKNQIFK